MRYMAKIEELENSPFSSKKNILFFLEQIFYGKYHTLAINQWQLEAAAAEFCPESLGHLVTKCKARVTHYGLNLASFKLCYCSVKSTCTIKNILLNIWCELFIQILKSFFLSETLDFQYNCFQASKNGSEFSTYLTKKWGRICQDA